ncbi:hypothetical protein [Vibrio harveyi]|uniref:hypothetical protein n=1 Tax=Vibrio harveyi TaxID=669 RepID=UPI00068234E1|nr:hypothetical protein [Vibrio harveyi]PNM43660.1 hypothetical protein AL469_027815 [Vibrio harveyi]
MFKKNDPKTIEAAKKGGSKKGKRKSTLFNAKLSEFLNQDTTQQQIEDFINKVLAGGGEQKVMMMNKLVEAHLQKEIYRDKLEAENEMNELKVAFKELTKRMERSELQSLIDSYYDEKESENVTE